MNKKDDKYILKRIILIEKSPFPIIYTGIDSLKEINFMVQNSEYSKKFYIIVEGKNRGHFVRKKFCTRLSKNR